MDVNDEDFGLGEYSDIEDFLSDDEDEFDTAGHPTAAFVPIDDVNLDCTADVAEDVLAELETVATLLPLLTMLREGDTDDRALNSIILNMAVSAVHKERHTLTIKGETVELPGKFDACDLVNELDDIRDLAEQVDHTSYDALAHRHFIKMPNAIITHHQVYELKQPEEGVASRDIKPLPEAYVISMVGIVEDNANNETTFNISYQEDGIDLSTDEVAKWAAERQADCLRRNRDIKEVHTLNGKPVIPYFCYDNKCLHAPCACKKKKMMHQEYTWASASLLETRKANGHTADRKTVRNICNKYHTNFNGRLVVMPFLLSSNVAMSICSTDTASMTDRFSTMSVEQLHDEKERVYARNSPAEVRGLTSALLARVTQEVVTCGLCKMVHRRGEEEAHSATLVHLRAVRKKKGYTLVTNPIIAINKGTSYIEHIKAAGARSGKCPKCNTVVSHICPDCPDGVCGQCLGLMVPADYSRSASRRYKDRKKRNNQPN